MDVALEGLSGHACIHLIIPALRSFTLNSLMAVPGRPGPCRAGPAGAAASSGETADVEAMEFGRERLVV